MRIIYAYTAMATAGASGCAVANMYRCFYCSNLIQDKLIGTVMGLITY